MSGGILVPPVPPPIEIRQELGSRYLLDPNEINVMGPFGEIDTAHTLDGGNVGTLAWSRLSGGYSFPWDVRLKRMYAQHYNCLLYTSPSPRDKRQSRMPSSA